MKPRAIRLFDYLYLGSSALGLLNYFIFDNAGLDEMEANRVLGGYESYFLAAVVLFSLGITLLLWWLVSERRSKVAKWIIVAFFAVGLLTFPAALAMGEGLSLGVVIITWIMYAGAVVCLFLPDAKAYFDGYESNPDVFS